MTVVSTIAQLIGSLGFLLYGMKMMSDGIQKSAGAKLHKILGLMTGNRFVAVLTGMFVTMIIQSSGATTVMVVSFVNAGLLSLKQSIGVIFGANIGTTVTAWIVSIFGFSFDISAIAIPVFGVGFLLTFIKKIKKESIGEALMGFGLLFLGLDLLSSAIPKIDSNNIAWLSFFTDKGPLGTIVAILSGMLFTMLLHSSSATTAIILTMAHNGILSWEFSAAMVLGCNIGSTIDSVIASIGTKVNARRAAVVHVLFNVVGTILAAIFLRPLLTLVDWIVPGPVSESITTHIAMLHTVFNLACTLIFLPFVNQLASLTERFVKPKENEIPETYILSFKAPGLVENTEAHLIRVEKEINDMANLSVDMFKRIRDGFTSRTEDFIEKHMKILATREDYADQMQEQISQYLVQCSQLALSENSKQNISLMLRIVDELESLTDDCYSIAVLLKRSIEKNMNFSNEDMERFNPYLDLVTTFLNFIQKHLHHKLTEEEWAQAQMLEDQIDKFRKTMKKIARVRLEEGANVKAELLYIDLVRNVEKIGDHAYSISEALSETVEF